MNTTYISKSGRIGRARKKNARRIAHRLWIHAKSLGCIHSLQTNKWIGYGSMIKEACQQCAKARLGGVLVAPIVFVNRKQRVNTDGFINLPDPFDDFDYE